MRNVTLVLRLLWVALLLTSAAPRDAHAAKTIFRCRINGQTTLSDQPCESTGGDDPARAGAAGNWKGQLQYQGVEAGTILDDAHSVAPVVLTLTADGKLSGESADNGCRWIGAWSQDGRSGEKLISVDVTLAGCRYAGFNRRYSGSLVLSNADGSGALRLVAYTPQITGSKVRVYDVGGTLRRTP